MVHTDAELPPNLCELWAPECGTRTITDADIQAMILLAQLTHPAIFMGTSHAHMFTETEQEFLLASLGLLMANQDIIRWVLCMMTGVGAEQPSVRLLEMINGFEPLQILPANAVANWGGFAPFLSFMVWNRGNTGNQAQVSMFASGSIDARVCAIVQGAAVLLHEMCHLAHIDMGELGLVHCDRAYMIHNSVQWALFQRHPLPSGCCDDATHDDVFACGATVHSSACATGQGSPAQFMTLEEALGEGLAIVYGAVEDVINDIGDALDTFFGNVFGGSTGGGTGGPSPEFCEVCPRACLGVTWNPMMTEEDWADCFGDIAEWERDRTSPEVGDKMSP